MSNSLMKCNGQSLSTNSSTEEVQRKIAAVYGIASLCSTEVNKNATKLWVSVLREYSAEIVETATDRLIRNEEMLKMPTPAVLIRYIKEIEHERYMEEYRKEQARRKKFEDAKKELKAKYDKKFNSAYNKCFYKEIDGNEYKRRTDALWAEWRKEFDQIVEQEKASMLELSDGKK